MVGRYEAKVQSIDGYLLPYRHVLSFDIFVACWHAYVSWMKHSLVKIPSKLSKFTCNLSRSFIFTQRAMNSTSDYPIIALGSPSMMSRQRSEADTEAALSLCALGGTTSTCFVDGHTNLHPSVHSKTCYSYPSIDVAVPVTEIGAINIIAAGSSSIHKLTSGCSALSTGDLILSQDVSKQLSTGSKHIDKKKKAASIVTPQRKNNMKPRDSKRDTSVSFEEMQRIMQVYGPIKAGRNRRKINHIGKVVKPELRKLLSH